MHSTHQVAQMERAVPILPGDDLQVARRFYVDGLGFRVLFEASENGRDGIMGIARGTIELTIDCPMSGHGRRACVSLRVNDADSWYREWHTAAKISTPPKNEPWGARTFGFQDPFDNTVFVIGPVTA
jgi:uncharacterized glyoxalase superfamily protein PhnB